jgi:hypothetical protein
VIVENRSQLSNGKGGFRVMFISECFHFGILNWVFGWERRTFRTAWIVHGRAGTDDGRGLAFCRFGQIKHVLIIAKIEINETREVWGARRNGWP